MKPITTKEIEAIEHLGDYIRDGLEEVKEEIHNLSNSDVVHALDDIRSVLDEMTNEVSELRVSMRDIARSLEIIANK
jgi:methyl-accepting chemotaxis protein